MLRETNLTDLKVALLGQMNYDWISLDAAYSSESRRTLMGQVLDGDRLA